MASLVKQASSSRTAWIVGLAVFGAAVVGAIAYVTGKSAGATPVPAPTPTPPVKAPGPTSGSTTGGTTTPGGGTASSGATGPTSGGTTTSSGGATSTSGATSSAGSTSGGSTASSGATASGGGGGVVSPFASWSRVTQLVPGKTYRMSMSVQSFQTAAGIIGTPTLTQWQNKLTATPAVLAPQQLQVWGALVPADWPSDDPSPLTEWHAQFVYGGTTTITPTASPFLFSFATYWGQA